ncbi:MAG: hypothetical protein PHN43_00890 [Patescibacteria group bacterium]|nr:hypothetical protein [Patescibacteria group bacterium]
MRSFAVAFLIAISLFFGFSVQASYNFVNESGLKETGEKLGYETNQNTDTFIESYVGQVLTVVFSILGLIFFALIIYSGFKWMTAQGNESKIGEAKKILINSIIGLIIIFASYAVSYFVLNALDSSQKVESETPTTVEE